MAVRSYLKRRVVVTGMGIVSCLGIGVDHVWQQLISGHCGIHKVHGKGYENIPCQVAGTVPQGSGLGQLDLNRFVDKSEQKTMSKATCYALVAAHEALEDAKWKPETAEEKESTGVAVGMGMVGLEEIVDTGTCLQDKGYRKVSPFFIPRILINMAAGHISLKHGFLGPNHSVSTACTTGVHAIGDAARFIENGDAQVMVCGGTEASVNPLGLAGFAKMRALSTNFNDSPKESSRPFDKDRDGFVMSEGAGILVLEDLDHALRRGCPQIYGEILGYGLSGDAYHMTAPSNTGDGAYRAMKSAIENANAKLVLLDHKHLQNQQEEQEKQNAVIKFQDIGYINAHATSTPLGDTAECCAIAKLCSNCDNHRAALDLIAVSSTKGAVGHLLGAAGSVEAIFTIMACHHGVLPPTLNCHHPDTGFDLNFVPLVKQSWNSDRRIALTNSFGFGGTNGSLCLSNYCS